MPLVITDDMFNFMDEPKPIYLTMKETRKYLNHIIYNNLGDMARLTVDGCEWEE